MKKIVALVLSLVMVLGLAVTASAVEPAKSYEDVYMLNVNAAAGTAATAVDTLNFYKEVVVKYDKVTGNRLSVVGTIAYYNDGTYDYVAVDTLAEATDVVYIDAAAKQVKFYLAKVDTTEYFDCTVITNFGEDCGEIDLGDDFDEDATYYAVKGTGTDIVLFVSDEDGDQVAKANGKFVPVSYIGVVDVVPHTAVVESEDGEVVKIYCSACGCVAAEAANLMSVPKGAELVGVDYWYWTTATAAPEAGETVESAKTFDAGIAMYVGMSVMAAAGSAVVLKKKD